MKLLDVLSRKPKLMNGRIWAVKVKDVKGLDLSFDTRKEAREYKRVLTNSRRQLSVQIVIQDFFDGYMEERDVT